MSDEPGGLDLDLPDPSRRCACGATHRVDIEAIVVATDALRRLAAFAGSRRWPGAAVVMDANTEEAAGGSVVGELERSGIGVERLRFPARAGLAADDAAVFAARGLLHGSPDAGVVAVGSGVITDITRYAAHLEGRDFVSVPTAASMDGYASSVAAMERDGAKVTYLARAPRAIFADPRVIAAAPAELTRAGLGDLLGKASARTDWLASHLLYGESFCAAIDARVAAPLTYAAEHVGAILAGESGASERLLSGLLQSGIAMAMAGSSRPASGCEHHASHFWDLLAARGRRRQAPHGLQVGYATRFAIRLQRFAFAGGVPALRAPRSHDPLDSRARAWLGEPTQALIAAIEKKRRFIAERAGRWPGQGRWGTVRTALARPLELSDRVECALDAAGFPARPGLLGLDARTLQATWRYASRLRARYTAIDFLEGQGALDRALAVALEPTSVSARGGG